MIRAEIGNIELHGPEPIILSEFITIIDAIYNQLTSTESEDYAEEQIARCGKIAMLGKSQIRQETVNALKEVIEDLESEDA